MNMKTMQTIKTLSNFVALRTVMAFCVLALASACTVSQELVVLLPQQDGKTGALDVAKESKNGDTAAPSVTLDQPYAAAETSGGGSTVAKSLTEAEVKSRFSEALSAQPITPKSFTLYFDEGSKQLRPASALLVESIFADIKRRGVAEIRVTGHTDRVGDTDFNDNLAAERAQLLRTLLIEQGVDGGTIIAVSRGEREPVVATEDGVAEPKNRRVVVTVR